MALHSPAVQAIRAGEYEIRLGDSLKQSTNVGSGLLSLRYNYRPENGSMKSLLTKHKVGPRSSYKLVVDDEVTNEPAYTYTGRDVSVARDDPRQESPALALVFDKSKPAFVLETISSALDFNLTSAPAEPDKDVNSLPQLAATKPTPKITENGDNKLPGPSHEDSDESPDFNNPFDYRHFLEEAREAAEHNAATGGASPLPGSRTPMSGMPSPIPGASRFLGNGASTSHSRPAPTSAPAHKKRKVDDYGVSKPTPRSQPAPTAAKKSTQQRKRGEPKATQALSKELISDSDSDADGDADMSDTITVARPQTQNFSSARNPIRHDHRTQLSSTAHIPRSPHIVVDDPSGLEIDMGSPPPASSGHRKRTRHLNRDAFRSQTGTPSLSYTPLSRAHHSNHRAELDSDVDMDASMRHENDQDQDVLMSDGDVEALELGSPRTNTRTVGSSRPSSRIQSVAPGDAEEDEDEDDALAAELEAALEEADNDDDDDDAGVGLGISGTANRVFAPAPVDDDESEVSEEE